MALRRHQAKCMEHSPLLEKPEVADHPAHGVLKSVVHGQELADLAMLYDPGITLVTAPIPPFPAALLHAEALAKSDLRQSKAEVSISDGKPVPGALDQLSMSNQEHAQAWVSYLGQVTELFANLLGARIVGVRQVVSDEPHCSRFHVDRVLARGVLNVIGACTEWLDESDVDRSRLGHAGGPDDATSGLVRDWSAVRRAQPGTLAVFKGTAWPGATERAVVHRSPPSDGKRRVVLTLDWLE